MRRLTIPLSIILALLGAIGALRATVNVPPNPLASRAVTAAVAAPTPIQGNSLVLAGDLVPALGPPGNGGAGAVRNLSESLNPAAIIHLGDLQYECGTIANFNRYYGGLYNDLKSKIIPVVGNHEYCNGSDPNASGFKSYFGIPSHSAMYNSYNLVLPSGKTVHILNINSNCQQWNKTYPGCGMTQAMRTWIRNDLAADTSKCRIAVWHEPAFGSQIPYHGDGKKAMRGVWETLQSRGVDYVITGHAHNYQRYRALRHDGVASSSGIASAIVGTGGKSNDQVTSFSFSGSRSALYDDFDGVLRMIFRDDGTGWIQSFKTTTGQTLDTVPFSC